MARNTTTASHHTESVDCALWCAAAQSWHALGLTVVALILIAPALAVGVLMVLEAALADSKTQSSYRSGPGPGPAGWRANVPLLFDFRPHAGSFSSRHA